MERRADDAEREPGIERAPRLDAPRMARDHRAGQRQDAREEKQPREERLRRPVGKDRHEQVVHEDPERQAGRQGGRQLAQPVPADLPRGSTVPEPGAATAVVGLIAGLSARRRRR